MFRAVLCSSSGGQIALLQHLVPSLSVNGRTVRRLRADTRCCNNTRTISLPEDEHSTARNMLRIVM